MSICGVNAIGRPHQRARRQSASWILAQAGPNAHTRTPGARLRRDFLRCVHEFPLKFTTRRYPGFAMRAPNACRTTLSSLLGNDNSLKRWTDYANGAWGTSDEYRRVTSGGQYKARVMALVQRVLASFLKKCARKSGGIHPTAGRNTTNQIADYATVTLSYSVFSNSARQPATSLPPSRKDRSRVPMRRFDIVQMSAPGGLDWLTWKLSNLIV